MFGLCMPTGEVSLLLKDGTKDCIALTDLSNPKEYILNDKNVLGWINHYGYENVESIIYERDNRTTKISMADYYYENASKLEKRD